MKVCRLCQESKALDEFYIVKSGTRDGLRAECKVCVRAMVKASPSALARRAAAADRQLHRVKADSKAQQARWYVNNREYAMARNREWMQTHPEENRRQRREARARRHARKYGNDFRRVTLQDWQRLVARHRGLCAYCSVRPWTEQDHIVPLARGGRHSIGNLLPACRACNRRKSSATIMEWRTRALS